MEMTGAAASPVAAAAAAAEKKALPLEEWWVAKRSVDMTADACCHCLGCDRHSFQGGFFQC